ncbi:MAG: hypothetical protein ACKODX_17230 [Gemmata sp.]
MTMAPASRFGVAAVANRTGSSLPKTVEKALELAAQFGPGAFETAPGADGNARYVIQGGRAYKKDQAK